MANNSNLSKRAALRQQQELEARQAKTRKIVMGGAAALGVVLLVVIAIVIVQVVGREADVTAEQLRPPHATEEDGISFVSAGEEASADAPHLTIWQDYQCPSCGYHSSVWGGAVEELADAGEISVEYRTAYFLDDNTPGDASKRASMAAAAADEVGLFREYHKAIYANQGSGYPNSLLRDDIPDQIGMDGEDLDRFQELYDGRAFSDFADAGNAAFVDSPWTGTPTYEVNGVRLEFIDPDTQDVLIEPTPEDVLRAINEAAGS